MRLSELFVSVNGEVTGHMQGSLTTFIRFQGCNLRCEYCDQKETWEVDVKTPQIAPADIVTMVSTRNVTLTGGEPLIQHNIEALISMLCRRGHKVTIETNGYSRIPVVCRNAAVSIVMDHKQGGVVTHSRDIYRVSGWNNDELHSKDVVKFIIRNREEFDAAVEQIPKYPTVGIVAFSPIESMLSAGELMEWMTEESSLTRARGVVLNAQLHKYINVK